MIFSAMTVAWFFPQPDSISSRLLSLAEVSLYSVATHYAQPMYTLEKYKKQQIAIQQYGFTAREPPSVVITKLVN